MDLSPSDTLEAVINRYPLTVEYFVDAGYDEWQVTVEDYVKRQGTSIRQLERELEDHLNGVVRPDVEDCESISCDPLPFCPEDVELIGVEQLFRGVEWLLRLPGRLFDRTEHSSR